ncbi:MAG TPA: hypothetical protein VFU47_15480 [Armatimonadota bacterium]|nr:hypothetical protein [Armatimonadota bacterium]
MAEAFSAEDFVRMALAEFPELREEFEEDSGLLHLQMAAFARLAQRAKGQGDWETYGRCVRLADQLWRRADPELLNALNVSFLEHLDFEGPRGTRAWEILTPALRKGWEDMQAYLDRLGDLSRSRPLPPH